MSFPKWIPALCLGVIAVLGTPAQAQQPMTVSIILTQPLTSTGLQVTQDQAITVTASGTMNWFTGSCNETCLSTPDGLSCPYTLNSSSS